MITHFILLGAPLDIDEGPLIPPPPDVKSENISVKIGFPVFILDRFDRDVIIDCIFLLEYIQLPSVGFTIDYNVSTIRVTDYRDGDVFSCKVDDIIGFDEESTAIRRVRTHFCIIRPSV